MSDEVEASDKNRLMSILLKDASIFAGASAGLYLFAYKFQEAFLRHFSVNSVFVEIDITTVLISASAVLAFFTIVWSVLNYITISRISFLIEFFFFHSIEIILALMLWAFYSYSGYSWIAVGLFFLLVIRALFLTHTLWKSKKDGVCYRELLGNNIVLEREIEKNLYGESAGYNISRTPIVMIYVVFLVFIPMLLGPIFGSYSANRKDSFQQTIIEDTSYILVSRYSNGFILSSVVQEEVETGEAWLDGKILYFDAAEMSRHVFETETYKNLSLREGTKTDPITFDEFLERLKNLF